ncbi:MAG TPA: AAA family ATPase, partial [Ramlibacter sp.]|nr:AAA family ATPase [Ramlibacter sp.]
IGRQHEAEVIAQSWDRACRGEPQSVQLIGEPGIGKSRLAQLALDIAREGPQAQTVVLQCSPLQTQSALAPVVAWLRRAVLGAETIAMSEAIASERLREFLRAELPGNPLAEPLIAPLVGLPAALPADLAADTPDARRLKTLQCIASLIGGAARPRLVVVEDLHWADPSTLELIELLAAGLSARPVMLLGTARPEWSTVDWRPTTCRRLAIQRLSHEDAVNLALHVVRNLSVESSIVQTIAQRTDGVPLFLEEMAKSIAETWLSHARTPEAAGGNKLQLSIPGSLTDSLMARLDRMDQGKSVAQAAATLGREFEHALLEAVWQGSPEVLHAGLEQLIASEMLFAHDEGAGVEYRFKHALIRDAAYESMLKSTRVEQHRSVAQAIEARFPVLAERRPELVAQHYTAGRENEKAVGYWLAAAQRALQQNAHVEALAHIRSGMAVCAELAEGPDRDRRELQLQAGAISALLAVQGYADPEVRISCERALELCEKLPGSPEQVIAMVGLFSFHVTSANLQQAIDMAQRFLAVSKAWANEDLLLEAHLDNGCAYLFHGDLATARMHLEACIALYNVERHGTHCFQFGQDPRGTAHVFLSWLEWIAGNPVRAREHSEESRRIAGLLRHPNTTAFSYSLASWHALYAGDLDTAEPLIAQDLAHCKDQQIQVFHAHADVLTACVRNELGDTGSLALDAAIDFFISTGTRVFLTHWQAWQAVVQARDGRAELAHQTMAEALGRIERSDEHYAEPEALRLRGEVLRHLGAPTAQVQAAYREALAVAQARGYRGWGVRAAVSLAKSLAAEQRGAEALEILREALVGFPAECPGENNIAEARRLVAEL